MFMYQTKLIFICYSVNICRVQSEFKEPLAPNFGESKSSHAVLP